MIAPIILFVYNRPEHARKTVEALATNELARESELWIFSDGAKSSASEERVTAVRSYVRTLADSGLFGSVCVIEAEQNLGLAQSIINGISRVMEKRDCAIVLEDDLITAPDFLVYMNLGLEYYRENALIGSVTGYSPLRCLPADYHNNVYLLPRNCSIGWATWKYHWEKVDWDVNDFQQFRRDRKARRRFNKCGSDYYDMLRRQMEIGVESWSIRFGYWQFKKGLYTVYPAVSRIRCIGWDSSGVHSTAIERTYRYNNVIFDEKTPFVLTTPSLDERIIRQAQSLYNGGRLTQLARWLRGNGFGFVDSAIKTLLSSQSRN